MNGLLLGTGIAVGAAALCAAGAAAGAVKLFNSVIPRRDGVRVDMKEMADDKRWEEYKKIIAPKKEYLLSQPCRELTIKSRDGLTLHGKYFPAAEPTDRVAVCFHGYTSSATANASFASFLHKQGISCLLVDNRGHGESEGKYIGFGVLDRYDCLSWLEYMNGELGGKARFMLYGVSMGASTALMAIGMEECDYDVELVVADCGFTSPEEVFSHVLKKDYKLPKFPIMNINNAICRKKAGYGFKDCSTDETLKKAKCPVLFVHGKNDNFVPVWMSERNYEVCSSEKELLLIENAGHGASYFENTELYESKVQEFIDRYFR